jgi:hypothetical protein
MDGFALTGAAVLSGNPGPAWHITDAEGVNADGRADIVLQNDDGSAAIWTMNSLCANRCRRAERQSGDRLACGLTPVLCAETRRVVFSFSCEERPILFLSESVAKLLTN